MAEKIIIGGKPMFDNPFGHCTFLGKFLGHDLYFTDVPGKAPDVLARSGEEPGEYVEGLKFSWGLDRALTAARRIAEYKKLLVLNPVKSMFCAYQQEDVSTVKKQLVTTPEYAALTAFQAGDVTEANRLLDELAATPEMLTKYPDAPLERMKHVDMNLFVLGRYLEGVFAPETYCKVAAQRIIELGGEPSKKTK